MFNVYFNEYNLLLGSGGISYLPFVSGILSANAKKEERLKKNFSFQPFIFVPDTPENIIKTYYKKKPHIAVFSISMWNEQLSLSVAKQVKEKWSPLIIFGGPSCPHDPTDFFKKYPFIDVCVRAEGEDAFNQILNKYLDDTNFIDIPNVSFKDKNHKCIINYNALKFNRDLSMYPSPYLTGEYDYLFENKNEHNYQIIIETNRGCPFLCTYCYWGKGGNTTKYRFHTLDRIFSEIDWIAKKKIKYVFNADSNFGMHRRDFEIAEKLVETKKKTGYPDKFRTCWGKNTSEQIFKIASLLNKYDMDKGVTLARQTNSKEALKNVKRDNIKLEAYSQLEKKFNHLKIPVYAEMILGLPGETNESWEEGLSSLVDTSVNNQIFIYQAEIYPNTEMNEDNYQKKHGIKGTKIKLYEAHCTPREQSWLKEFQYIVTQTNTMTVKDWQDRNIFSVVLMILHSFKVGFYYLNYFINELKMPSRDFLSGFIHFARKNNSKIILEKIINRSEFWTLDLLRGEGRGVLEEKFSDVFLDLEEAIFVELSLDWQSFYDELEKIIFQLLDKGNYKYDSEILSEIKKYQILRMPKIDGENKTESFEYNIAEYMFACTSQDYVKLKKNKNIVKSINVKNYKGNFHDFVREKIIWARKSDKIKNQIDYDENLLHKLKKVLISSDEEKLNPELFDEKNKFEKYSALDLNKNRRLSS